MDRRRSARPAWLGLAAGVMALAGCGARGPLIATPPDVAQADSQQETCKVAKDPLNPLIVEWPGTSKVDLDRISQDSIVVVSYVGCTLKVLTNCTAQGNYDLKNVTPVRDKVSIQNEDDLYAKLPLGVVSLKSELATSGQLDLEYVAVGERASAKPPATISGECTGATHYVRTITVGAYGLDALGKAKVNGSVDVAGKAGGGGEHDESVRHLRGSGDVEKCASGQGNAQECGAILQLGLAPLMVGGGGSVTSAGFGAGLGAVAAVPTVQEVNLVGDAQSLQAADVNLLELLQQAKRADKGSDNTAQDKADAWAKLAAYEGSNPYKDLAQKRHDDWARVADAEVRRRQQIAKVCTQHDTDTGKLAQLVAMDDDVVTPKQKDAYRRELAQVYAPFASILSQCSTPSSLVDPTSTGAPSPSPDTPSADSSDTFWNRLKNFQGKATADSQLSGGLVTYQTAGTYQMTYKGAPNNTQYGFYFGQPATLVGGEFEGSFGGKFVRFTPLMRFAVASNVPLLARTNLQNSDNSGSLSLGSSPTASMTLFEIMPGLGLRLPLDFVSLEAGGRAGLSYLNVSPDGVDYNSQSVFGFFAVEGYGEVQVMPFCNLGVAGTVAYEGQLVSGGISMVNAGARLVYQWWDEGAPSSCQ